MQTAAQQPDEQTFQSNTGGACVDFIIPPAGDAELIQPGRFVAGMTELQIESADYSEGGYDNGAPGILNVTIFAGHEREQARYVHQALHEEKWTADGGRQLASLRAENADLRLELLNEKSTTFFWINAFDGMNQRTLFQHFIDILAERVLVPVLRGYDRLMGRG